MPSTPCGPSGSAAARARPKRPAGQGARRPWSGRIWWWPWSNFTRAIQIDPKFRRGVYQRAIAHYLSEDLTNRLRDCHMAVQLMPCHFGAWAGLGHGHAHEGRFKEALKCFTRKGVVDPILTRNVFKRRVTSWNARSANERISKSARGVRAGRCIAGWCCCAGWERVGLCLLGGVGFS